MGEIFVLFFTIFFICALLFIKFWIWKECSKKSEETSLRNENVSTDAVVMMEPSASRVPWETEPLAPMVPWVQPRVPRNMEPSVPREMEPSAPREMELLSNDLASPTG